MPLSVAAPQYHYLPTLVVMAVEEAEAGLVEVAAGIGKPKPFA